MMELGQRIATVFGGSGFLGAYVVRKLAQDGFVVRVACRRTDLAERLRSLGDVGQIAPFYAPVEDESAVATALRGASTVINLAAVLGGRALETVNVAGAGRVARLASAEGVTSFIHMSALGASVSSPSAYGRSRGAGEAEVRQHFPDATILRASVLFGPEDGFFNLMGALARYVPLALPVYSARTRLQPVYVADVAEATRRAVAAFGEGEAAAPGSLRRSRASHVYELGGPEVLSMTEIGRKVLEMTGRRKVVFAVPDGIAELQAAVLERLPGRMLTRDQLLMLSVDNVVTGVEPGLEAFGITPTPLGLVAPQYMARFRDAS
ncbi:NADH-ubiquinone oxidoreductase 39 kDa subunit [Acetobacter nitrogenifigens DSM 23921 = NBRC 105050]|uniref:3-beta-hydroxy-Delta(5)-steroid dehydrogenase n=2 Tax=Acetobacter nitrogenifigens TaxID=285268 RepID=A0A511XE27_9PROT|nr:NADH-ubiquinone oxidoreductase 39 kDa subunit [Acetobacter nitrogenifigens DSM 23921 = NBRC 105050]GEN61135.1 3-beta-hydroxy-Delta(5)-steroid dehydrogenase [Acetobacter nitrogenifigens DSM 23921 = NBRC 105050]